MFLEILTTVTILTAVAIMAKIYTKINVKWCTSQRCLVGKTTIVTGGNTGIGYEIALDFAKRGARVILACRNPQLGQEACERIARETENPFITFQHLDLASFESVRKFARSINTNEQCLDILVNNAAILTTGTSKTVDGNELVFQVNYLSLFLLTNLLLNLLKKSTQSRIVNVSSIIVKFHRKLEIEKLNTFSSGTFTAYKESKVCALLFTQELARRLEGTRVETYSADPGFTKTNIHRYEFKRIGDYAIDMIAKTSQEGAQTPIYCAIAKEVEGHSGFFFENSKKVSFSSDPNLEKKLWEYSETIVALPR